MLSFPCRPSLAFPLYPLPYRVPDLEPSLPFLNLTPTPPKSSSLQTYQSLVMSEPQALMVKGSPLLSWLLMSAEGGSSSGPAGSAAGTAFCLWIDESCSSTLHFCSWLFPRVLQMALISSPQELIYFPNTPLPHTHPSDLQEN